jgi:hypothetical protein
MLTLPITESTKNQEWNRICTMAKNNDFPLHITQRIKNNLLSSTPLQATEQIPRKILIPFTFHSPLNIGSLYIDVFTYHLCTIYSYYSAL